LVATLLDNGFDWLLKTSVPSIKRKRKATTGAIDPFTVRAGSNVSVPMNCVPGVSCGGSFGSVTSWSRVPTTARNPYSTGAASAFLRASVANRNSREKAEAGRRMKHSRP
jgi:hypothetical protein